MLFLNEKKCYKPVTNFQEAFCEAVLERSLISFGRKINFFRRKLEFLSKEIKIPFEGNFGGKITIRNSVSRCGNRCLPPSAQ